MVTSAQSRRTNCMQHWWWKHHRKTRNIATRATVDHYRQAHETYGEARRILENVATLDKTIKQQIIGTTEDTSTT